MLSTSWNESPRAASSDLVRTTALDRCGRMVTVRFIAVILAVTLTGPSVASVLCDWTCAAKHQVASAEGGCHKRDSSAPVPAVAAGHVCHDLLSPEASVLTPAPYVEVLTPSLTELLPADSLATISTRTVATSPDTSHDPPRSSVPLRI